MAISSPGLGSNLDVNSIISKLMQVEARPLAALAKKEASYQARLSAYGNLSSALSSFQSSLSSLNNLATFQSLTATPSDGTVLSASAGSKAVPGNYNVNVTQVAQAQTLSTSGTASTTATIGGGSSVTLTFQFGTITGGKLVDGRYATDTTADPQEPSFTQDANQASGSVTIDNTNNSLQGIRDAINKAGIGVTATIVSDGSASPNRLVLTSAKTGAASSMKVSVQGTEPALSDLLAFDPAPTGIQSMQQTAAAQNTTLTINGIPVTSASSTVSEAIQGVTINVSKTGASTLAVSRNTAGIQSNISALVKSYNELNGTIKNLTGYNPQTKQAGPLIGDAAAQAIQVQLRKTLSSSLGGPDATLKTLSQVGLSFQKDGTMTLDAAKLTKALGNGTEDVAALFSSIGRTTDSLVSYVSSTSDTRVATSDVYVTSLATQGRVTGDDPILSLTKIDDQNDQLTVTVDGVAATVNLLRKADYSQSELVAQIQSAINGAPTLSSAGISVKVSIDSSNLLSIVSNRYGSLSKVSASGSSTATLFGNANSFAGEDIVGTIGGVPGIGSGQFLTGAKGSPADGLKLQITGGEPNASRGTVSFTQGFAFQLNKLVEGFVGTSGPLRGRTEGITASINGIDRARSALDTRLAAVEKRYRAQFTALDATISRMSSTSTFLAQQLASLNKSS